MTTESAGDSAPASTSPSARSTVSQGSAETPTPAAASAPEELVRHKRPRAALDPSTPKGEGDEGKTLSGMTPAAKKGRVEGDDDVGSDTDRATSPPAGAATTSSRPATPPNTLIPSGPPATEGKDTKQLRERVQALKPPGQSGEGESSAADAEIAEVADEVSASAAKPGDEQDKKEEKDVEIAEVAAEVNKSAQKLAKEDERQAQDRADGIGEGESKEKAQVAAEVSDSAAKVQAEDEKIADTASETAEAAAATPEAVPASKHNQATAVQPFEPKTQPKPQPTFASYSSTASPFSAFASSASPLASVTSPTKPAAETQKPKAKSAFSTSPFLSTAATSVSGTASTSTSADPKTETKPTAERSTTPFTKAEATTNLASASPFSAFSSTSGFAAASKPGSASAFSAFSAAPSAFSSVPSTAHKPSASGGEEGEDSSASGSTKEGASAAEVTEAEEPERVFIKQETVTGEEEERLIHSVRCKLYAMSEGQWAERGTGNLKLNESDKEDGKKGARLLMRADATHRLLLNAPLFSAFSIEVHSEKYVRFSAIEGATPTSYMLRTGNPAAASNLVKAVQDEVATL